MNAPLLWAIRISLVAKSNDNSHSFFLWVVLLNLTIYWVRENNAFIFRTQKSVNIKAELFGVELSTNNSMSDFAWHGPGSFYIQGVFTWHHGFHIGVPKQWNGGHVGVPIAWNSSDCFESFSPLKNVCIDRPLMPSSDVTHYRKPGSDFDWLIV